MVFVREIAKTLANNDALLIQEWRTFYDSLSLGPAKLAQLEYRYRTSTIEIVDLILEIITAWVAKQGVEATIPNLAHILQQESFYSASELLQTNYPEEEEITVHVLIQSSSSSSVQNNSPSVPPLIWYGIDKPMPNFQGRSSELEQISTSFTSQQLAGQSPRVFMQGLPRSGKTELAKVFITKFHLQENANCVWIDGKDSKLKRNLSIFLNQLPPPQEGHSDDMFAPLKNAIEASITAWLIVFDNVDDASSIQVLKTFLHKIASFPPSQDPFILVLSREDITNTSLKLEHWTESSLQCLAAYCTSILLPEVLVNCKGFDSALIRSVVTKVAQAFEELGGQTDKLQYPTEVIMTVAISLLSLAAYFIVEDAAEDIFLKLWDCYAELSSQDEAPLSKIQLQNETLSTFSKCIGIFSSKFTNEYKLECPKIEVRLILRNMFKCCFPLRKKMWLSLNPETDKSENDIVIKLMRAIVSTHVQDRSIGIHNISTTVMQILSDGTIVHQFKQDLPIVLNSANDPNFLQSVYDTYRTQFGVADDSAMQIKLYLAQSLLASGDKIGALQNCTTLYQTSRAKYGCAHPTTFTAYQTVLACTEKGPASIQLREEMVKELEKVAPYEARTIEEKLELGEELRSLNDPRARTVFRELLPVCKKHHPGDYDGRLKQHLSEPVGAEAAVVNSVSCLRRVLGEGPFRIIVAVISFGLIVGGVTLLKVLNVF